MAEKEGAANWQASLPGLLEHEERLALWNSFPEAAHEELLEELARLMARLMLRIAEKEARNEAGDDDPRTAS